jgi:hypothetical protein
VAPQLLAGRAGAVAAFLDRSEQLQAAVDGRGLVPPAVGVAVAGLVRRVHVDEVGCRSQVVELDEAVAGGQAFAAAQRVVVVVDGHVVVGLLLQPDLEALEAAFFGVRGAVGPGVVGEDEDPELAERERVVLTLRGQVDPRRQ